MSAARPGPARLRVGLAARAAAIRTSLSFPLSSFPWSQTSTSHRPCESALPTTPRRARSADFLLARCWGRITAAASMICARACAARRTVSRPQRVLAVRARIIPRWARSSWSRSGFSSARASLHGTAGLTGAAMSCIGPCNTSSRPAPRRRSLRPAGEVASGSFRPRWPHRPQSFREGPWTCSGPARGARPSACSGRASTALHCRRRRRWCRLRVSHSGGSASEQSLSPGGTLLTTAARTNRCRSAIYLCPSYPPGRGVIGGGGSSGRRAFRILSTTVVPPKTPRNVLMTMAQPVEIPPPIQSTKHSTNPLRMTRRESSFPSM